jgi:hypothetical protein
VDVMAREHAFTMENYMDAIAEIKDNNMIVLPDLIPILLAILLLM